MTLHGIQWVEDVLRRVRDTPDLVRPRLGLSEGEVPVKDRPRERLLVMAALGFSPDYTRRAHDENPRRFT
jgi:hypothetical protein